MPEAVFHILVIALIAVVMATFIFWIFRWETLRSREVLRQASEQMRKTGILLRLTATSTPDEIQMVQRQLTRLGLYQGDPDGVLDQETIDALHKLADSSHIDVDTEVGKMFLIEEPKRREAVKSARACLVRSSLQNGDSRGHLV